MKRKKSSTNRIEKGLHFYFFVSTTTNFNQFNIILYGYTCSKCATNIFAAFFKFIDDQIAERRSNWPIKVVSCVGSHKTWERTECGCNMSFFSWRSLFSDVTYFSSSKNIWKYRLFMFKSVICFISLVLIRITSAA